MHELCKQFRFDSAHTLEREVETASSRRVHGHSYRAEVAIRGELDKRGMVLDLAILTGALDSVRERLDHHFLNEVEGLGPATLENLAAWVWGQLDGQCPGLWRVTIARDSSGDSCSYFGASPR